MPETETIVRGRPFLVELVDYDNYDPRLPDGGPDAEVVDHTDWTIKAQIRTKLPEKKTGKGRLVANLNVTFPVPANGGILVSNDADFTAALELSKPGELWWDIVAYDEDGREQVILPPAPIDIVDWPTEYPPPP